MIIGGAVADKFPKNIMFYSNIVRAILVATILTWFIVGDVTLYTFALFALFFGLADAFSGQLMDLSCLNLSKKPFNTSKLTYTNDKPSIGHIRPCTWRHSYQIYEL